MEPHNSTPPLNLSGSDLEQDVFDWRPDPTLRIMAQGHALIMAIGMAICGGVAVKVYRKHRNDLEPLHIFELNTLANFSVFFLVRAIKLLVILQLTNSVLCSIIQWLNFYSLPKYVSLYHSILTNLTSFI